MLGSVVLSVFTLLCNHHYHPSLELFQKTNSDPFNSNSFFPPPPPGNHHSTSYFCEFDHPKSHSHSALLFSYLNDACNIMSSRCSHVLMCLRIPFPLWGLMIDYILFSHSLMAMWHASIFWLCQIILLRMWIYKYLLKYLLCILVYLPKIGISVSNSLIFEEPLYCFLKWLYHIIF